MNNKIVVLKYQNSFADNFSNIAYGKILENKFDLNCFWENTTVDRKHFETQMDNFKLDYSYISKSRVEKIQNKHQFMDYKDIHSKKITNDKILSINNFKIDDIDSITSDIKSMFDFKNLDFIKDYDILENITSSNSIGIYINQNDPIDYNYINKCLNRLNKYVKKPNVYIFTSKQIDFDFDIKYKKLNLYDWREEFYFLKNCKHKIIHCTKNSYSEGFWASILSSHKSYFYTLFDKKLSPTKQFENWIGI